MVEQKPQDKKPAQPSSGNMGTGSVVGIGVGIALGTALGSLAVGVALGAGIGVALGAIFEQQGHKK